MEDEPCPTLGNVVKLIIVILNRMVDSLIVKFIIEA